MIAQTDFDRALGAWFNSEAAGAPPSEPLAQVIASTRRLRPRASLTAGLGSAWVGSGVTSAMRYRLFELRRPALIALVALLTLALVVAAALVAGQLVRPRPAPRTYLDHFVAAPDLSRLIAYPTVVPLLDSRVLVIGNEGDGGSQTNVGVVYDPATGVSVAAGPLLSADSVAISAAVRLLDGRVLVVGAEGSQIFDPTTLQFAAVGPMAAAARWGAAAALLPDGRVLVSGGTSANGESQPLNTAELFDPRTLSFSPTGAMSAQRSGHSMVALADGRVFVMSGQSQVADLYDPATGAFAPAGTAATNIDGPTALLADGRVAIFVGQGLQTRTLAWAWDPADFTFAYLQELPLVSAAAPLDDGRLLLIGGRPDPWAGVFEATTSTFTYLGPPSAYRPALTPLLDGRVLVVGGLEDGLIRPINGGTLAPGVATVEVFE